MVGSTELLIILGIVVIVFGAQKLPQLGAGVGQAIRNFRSEMNRKDEDPKLPEHLDSDNPEKKQLPPA